MIEYTLSRSKRKTVALFIRNSGVEVRAPLKTPVSEIERFIASKEKWIAEKLAVLHEQANRRKAFFLDYGSSVPYRGKEYPITAKPGSRAGFDSASFYMPPNLNHEEIKAACIKVYRSLAKRALTDRALGFAMRMDVVPSAIRINGAKTRWGSCSAKKSLNFSWMLVMADDDVIDYVVVHELAHIIELNHSARFWAIIEDILPDYRQQKRKLKELQSRLSVEDW